MILGRFLKQARKLALKNPDLKRGFGAVIVDGNRVVSIGRNRRSHPGIPDIQLNDMRYWGLHAETDALLRVNESVHGMTVYIHGLNRTTGTTVNSQPCKLCAKMLKERGVHKAVYVTPDGIKEILL